ncbi:putative P-loop containing nucleoside triphosphate hydrolase, leucine-rich repeat domain, L [Medicago truncatula]|uniref:Putative P-loop containing nucleoside triphosphate hydrolase, leucine-rich repeat domain, L n=1 Tax=Medicago truncatula TaxID=3880 RepID=A0A396JK59_MEDTR|nr:uncharacterized protein LOC11428573 [Medicago truncatula]XP_039690541.1 uncharacterized protein LOC11428573 [Medicago truncatula]RHN78626.1 putative P-loop containing nucleoside triphosphate hydrolase, leucine-rich repeat domain, L [Medicago truncatula]
MEILSSVVGKVADYTVVSVGRQASYLIFYKANFKMLAVHVKDLEVARERIIHSVEEERRNGKEIERDVVNWLDMVNEVIEKANQLQRDPRRANVRCSTWSFPNLILCHELSRKATKVAKDIVQVQGKGMFDRVGYLPTLEGVASSSSTRGGENYETRKSFKEDILKALTDLNSCNIGVYGLGGVGKTTMVEEVAKTAIQNKLFDKVVITHVSKHQDFKTIQGEIADLLSLQFVEETIAGRAHRLRQRIKMEKSIIVILDDIWSILDLKKVGIPFGKEHNGCKLLMTSRNQDVLLQMDVPKDFTFKLELMRENETWSLFQFMAGDVVKDNNVKDVAIQVAQKCAGLPLRVVTIARAMKNKWDVQSWKDALRKLQSNDHTEMDKLTNSALELSYNALESNETRDLFLLFALLPIKEIEYVLKVAVGLDILKHINTMDDARNKLYTIIKSLEATCLLLEVKTSRCIQMHDFVRNFCISKAHTKKRMFLRKPQEEWSTKDFLERCTQIVLFRCPMNGLPQTIDCPNIKLFFLLSENRSLEIPDTFFEGMRSLKVLDLMNFNLPSLPSSFQFLTELQTLCLNLCILENIDAIEALQNLKILDLSSSSIIKLPSEIGRLTKLRMLDLSNSGIEVVPPNIISSLTKLEELYMGNTSFNWEDVNPTGQSENASIVELQKLPNLIALELQIRKTWMLPRDLQLMFEKLERYKIAIGDVWEWSQIEDGTSKTLMLKLGTNIHLEHGIKALVKGVENLYLDEVDGIQNVLYQLNGVGFPLLKHLHIQNNVNMKHIVDSKERNQFHVSFPILETLVLHNLKNLEHICDGPLLITSFENLSAIKVKKCSQLKYLFSFTMAKGLSHLSNIEVCDCNSMKEIVLKDNNLSANNDEKIEFLQLRSLTLEHLETLDNFFSYYLTHSGNMQKYQGLEPYVSTPFFGAQVAFCNLETLKLSSLRNLNKIWDDSHYSMYNLTTLIVEKCGALKYLFSSTVVGSFKNLQHLEISNCPLMEEIIAKEEISDALKEDNFFKLEKIILKDMDNLKTIWYRQFETVKMLEVNNCKQIVVVFPSSMQKTYNMLEILVVTNCAFVEEIFELTFNGNTSVEDTSQLKEFTIGELPKLKKIWSRDPQGIPNFGNLIHVELNNCSRLEYLLPLSIATRCSHLKELGIKNCASMKEIVAKEKENSVFADPIFEFNKLSRLMFYNLGKLKGFYAGNYTLVCPSLRDIHVFNCAKLNVYRTLSTSSSKSNHQDGKLLDLIQQPLFIVEEVIPNLKELGIDQKEANIILQAQNSNALFSKMTLLVLSDFKNEEATFPYWFLQNVRTLEVLSVECSCFKKIFQDEEQISEETHTKIKALVLTKLPKLQQLCKEGSRIDPVLEFLEEFIVNGCSSLTNLFPSSVTLNNLEYLKIENCNGLKYLITSFTARSLDKLTTLEVKDCNSLEEVIKGEENVGITFITLETLKLECLPSLNKFCSSNGFLKFPLLKEVIVRECPRMKKFSEGNISTPILRKIKIAENDEEWHWKENLNDTINNMFEDKVAFGYFKHLKLSEYPELKESWYGKLEHNVFRSLKYLVVHNCDFLSEVLFQPNLLEVLTNLEELDIKDCNSLEAVFDLKDEFAKEIVVKNSSQLKKLKLSNVPKLKHVWKEDPHDTMRFQNLSEVSVEECTSLISIFPLTVARDMMQLQSLRVSNCGIEEIVAKEEGTNEIVNFVFSHLTFIRLELLPKLKAFFVGVHSLQCKSLKTIYLFGCPKIELFKTELRHQESSRSDVLNISTYQPLFVIEEVLTNVERLALNNKDLGILQSQYSGVQFNNVKHIDVCQFYTEEDAFPYWFLKNVPSLESLLVQWSIFTEIFQGEQLISTEKETQISPRLKLLKLWQLHKLQYICKEGFKMDPILHFIEIIIVHQCSSLIKLVPSSVTFTYLTYLEVANCNGLINLITYSTAKSLVKLTTMKIKMCNLLEDIVNGKEDETDEIEFQSLQFLELNSLPRLHQLCSCPCPIKFPLLEVVVVKECARMELFSSGVTNTPNLQIVQIEESNEENDEQNHWEGDLNRSVNKLFDDKVAFGSFKHLKLSEYPELKELWYGKLEHNVFRSLKCLVVHKCEFLSEVLFRPNLLEVLTNLEELDIKDCNSLEAVFDLKDEFAKEIVVKNSSQLKKLKLSNVPKLKHVWKEDPRDTMRFQNLSEVSVEECTSLISIFPLTVARDMMQLQSLRVSNCGIEEIVAKEEGTNEIVNFVFSHLTFIRLELLPKLKAFFVGVHSLQCKSLKTIYLFGCPKIELFKTELRHQESSRSEVLNISTYQPLFVIEEVLTNVERLALNNKDFGILQSQYSGVQFNNVKHIDVCEFYTEEATFPYWFLKNVPSLESLLVQWSLFTEIFQGEQLISTEKETQISPRLKQLELGQLHRLQYICKEGFKMDPILHFIESINVNHCSSLIKLVPSSVTFTYLTYLEVTSCNGLINLITYSTAKSLVKLTTMKIKMCNLLEDIVNGKEDETKEIEFCSLQSLELISLPRVCRFCSCPCPITFPLLEVVVVKECPRMELLSLGVTNTPNLQIVQIEESNEENHWEGDLNRSVKKLFDDKVAFREFKYLALSDHSELEDIWYGRLDHNVFCNLKHLVVERCDFLSQVLFPSNVVQVLHGLEELEVRNCDSLEVVFDVRDLKTKEILIKQRTRLKSLTLSGLPNLKHIWNEDPYEIVNFENLCKVKVSMCQSLSYIFPFSLCQDLRLLEILEVVSCRVEVIIAMEERSMESNFCFPQLNTLVLRLLSNLKSFYPRKYTLECPSLKILNVYRCQALKMFSFNHLDFQQPNPVDETRDVQFQQALFSIKKLSLNLKELAINGTDVLGILNQENIYNEVQILRLQCLDETPATFLNEYAQRVFPNLETFQVRNSSFETLFPNPGDLNLQTSKQIRNLWLFELENLKHIWQEVFPLDHPMLQYLEDLSVRNCPCLISLVPSSTSFTNLINLTVDNCKEMIYLITSSTAKSLIQLTTLKIKNCEKMLDVVKIDEEKAEENIIFENLEYLKFISLSSLRSFCYEKQAFIFPSLLRFVVKGCPQMKIFSSGVTVAPYLTRIETDEGKMRWKGDLNTTIEELFIEKEVPV